MSQTARRVRILSRTRETADIATFELASDDGSALPAFTAGAHIDVEVAPALLRQYSLLALPNAANTYRIGVLKDPQSRGGSVAIHALDIGAHVSISEPRNHFALQPGNHRTLLFGGGIGITPLLAMAEELGAKGADFELHYCARSQAHAAFIDALAHRPYADRVYVHLDDGEAGQKLDIDYVLSANTSAHIYVCGPGGFIGWIEDAAARAGLRPDNFHREYFKADPVAEPPSNVGAPEGEFLVKLARSGMTVVVPADRSILAVLADQGIDLPKSCEAGVCGTCLTAVIEGEPDHRDYYLSKSEKAKGDQILPCCSRSKSPVLVLDL